MTNWWCHLLVPKQNIKCYLPYIFSFWVIGTAKTLKPICINHFWVLGILINGYFLLNSKYHKLPFPNLLRESKYEKYNVLKETSLREELLHCINDKTCNSAFKLIIIFFSSLFDRIERSNYLKGEGANTFSL